MYCISVSYKKAPAEIRGRFAFDAREKEALAGTLRESGAVDGCVGSAPATAARYTYPAERRPSGRSRRRWPP